MYIALLNNSVGSVALILVHRLRSFMETDPKGQLGGLETNDAVRRRLAVESHSFRCSTCGKTNLEIIQDCERDSKTASSSGDPATVEVEIPSELKMAWKDEMAQDPSRVKASNSARGEPVVSTSSDNDESAVLAEGFVQTTTGQLQSGVTLANSNDLTSDAGTRAIQTLTQPPPPETRHVYIPVDDGVPLWVDRTIVVLVILLISMVLKVMLGV
jgi:ubiquitin-conjugating enzyme E2 J1